MKSATKIIHHHSQQNKNFREVIIEIFMLDSMMFGNNVTIILKSHCNKGNGLYAFGKIKGSKPRATGWLLMIYKNK